MPTVKINTCDKDWFNRDYVFYDNKGNPMNILYDSELRRYTGRQYFPENSSDTFKELELNVFERIKGFEYQQYTVGTGSTTNELLTRKFQLFNTEGIQFVGNTQSVSVTKIEAVNKDPQYYSKWVYGDNIDLLFPYGTEIKFSQDIFSISDEELYTVVNSKQDAVLIVTPQNNKDFVENIGGAINDESNYVGLIASGVNAIKIYDYINEDYENVFPDWSEPNFYNYIFKGQKLSVVNSSSNDGVYSVEDKTLGDNYYTDYKLLVSDLDGDLVIKVINKTSNFNVFNGGITFSSSGGYMEISDNQVIPSLLRPGVEFRVPASINNNKILTVSDVDVFNNVTTTYYSDGGTSSMPDLVLYDNRIYKCVQSYTQSATSSVPMEDTTVDELSQLQSELFSRTAYVEDTDDGPSSAIDSITTDDEEVVIYEAINPLNKDYWKLTDFIYVTQNLVDESLSDVNIFLNDNQVNFAYTYDNDLSSRVNLAKSFESIREDLDSLGAYPYVDPLGYYGIIKSKYPTKYIDVEFYVDKIDTFSGSITDGTNFSPTGYTFSYDPHETTDLVVKVNGDKVSISEDYLSASAFIYFSNTGASASLDFESLDENTGLYWKEINANFGLTASDIVTVEYTTEVSIEQNIIERVIQVSEDLVDELNEDFSLRPERRIVIDDIDEFGLVITINDQEYKIESTLLYRDNGEIDLEESVDRTIKKWIEVWKLTLDKIGIFVSSENFGFNNITSLHNSLLIRGVYPNIELDVSVRVGDTANFYFPDKYVTFHQLGGTSSVLSIRVNNINYTQAYDTSIETTLSNWVTSYTEQLNDKDIYVQQLNQSLYFTKTENIDINLDINVGKLFYPGEKVVTTIEYWIQNQGLIITSNSILQNNTDISFEEECFSTGHIISLNKSEWVLNNQEYNIIYLDPNIMVLSYQGPFWGSVDNSVQSAFFNLAFGDDLEIGDPIIAIVGGNPVSGTVVNVGASTYQVLYNVNQLITVERKNAWYYDPGSTYSSISSLTQSASYIEAYTGLTDIQYYNNIYKLNVTSDSLYFLDKEDLRTRSTIDLGENVIKQVSNPINNYTYLLTNSLVYIVDPTIEELIATASNSDMAGLTYSGIAYDIACDTKRGDVYVSYTDSDRIGKIDIEDLSTSSSDYYPGYKYGKMTYNRDDDKMYVFTRSVSNINDTTDGSKAVYRIDLDTNSIDNTFSMTGSNVRFLGRNDGYLGGGTYSGTIHYNEFNGDMYIGGGATVSGTHSFWKINTSTESLELIPIHTTSYYSTALDSVNKRFWVSGAYNSLAYIDENGNNGISDLGGTYGYLMYNDVDSNLYIASQNGNNKLYVYSTFLDQIFYTFDLDYELDKIVHNKYKDSINGISATYSTIVDVPISFIYNQLKIFSSIFNVSSEVTPTEFTFEGDQYGSFADDYQEPELMYIKTRDFIRRPRKNYTTTGAPQVTWEVKWDRDDVDEIFLFDISGDHLPTTGSYAYIGDKPLPNPTLRRDPNDNLDLVSESFAQQTIFATMSYLLDYNDSETNISFTPEGIQLFTGFNSGTEGVVGSKLRIIEKEDINVSFRSYESYYSATFSVTLPDQYLTFYNNVDSGYGEILLSENSTDTFDQIIDLATFVSSNTNLKEGHMIRIKIVDTENRNTSDEYISTNNKMVARIHRIFQRKLVLTNVDGRTFTNESTNLDSGYLTVNIEVLPKDVVNIDYYGQTEIEVIRFKTELSNTGRRINPEEVFIFKDYDINEGGMDWNYLNNKRKELLMVRNDIYNYIGAYRSIINAINFFGYNDLELYEYFRNININSENYLKLSKIEIPDIFDNSIAGWSEEYRKHHYPNVNYEDTNMFNLAYRFTDFDGNNRQTYSLAEAIIKLSGLKKWLEKNIIPITHKILDITGRSDVRSNHQIYHTPSSVTNYVIQDSITPVNFDINEVYVLPVQSGSKVYNVVVDFGVGETSSMVDYFTLDIKTYKTYDEWDVFESYSYEDKVSYFGKIYENVLLDTTPTATDPTSIKNTNNNPREYDEVETWSANVDYNEGDLVEYERRFYQYSLQTQNVNYLPWLTATGSCIIGTPSTTNGVYDNFYNDLVDRIANEENIPVYWVSNGNDESNFDVLDIVKSNYPTQWCDLLDRNESLYENIIIDLINLPTEQYVGDKPQTNREAFDLIDQLVNDYNLVKENYKLKFSSYNPKENLLLDNPDFILWDDITKWVEIDIEPVQSIHEYRSGEDMLLPFNFTIDSSIDPYVIVTCRSNNGYGQVKAIKKSYEIKFNADSDSVLVKTVR